jgi:hypothetical protein
VLSCGHHIGIHDEAGFELYLALYVEWCFIDDFMGEAAQKIRHKNGKSRNCHVFSSRIFLAKQVLAPYHSSATSKKAVALAFALAQIN